MTVLKWELQAEDVSVSQTVDGITKNVAQWRSEVESLTTAYNKLGRASETREQADQRRAEMSAQRQARTAYLQARTIEVSNRVAAAEALNQQKIATAQAKTDSARQKGAAVAAETATRTAIAGDRQTTAATLNQQKIVAGQVKVDSANQKGAVVAADAASKIAASNNKAAVSAATAADRIASSNDKTAQSAAQTAAKTATAEANRERAETQAAAAADRRTAQNERDAQRRIDLANRAAAAEVNASNRIAQARERLEGVTRRVTGAISGFWERVLGTAGGIILYRAFDLLAQGIGAVTQAITEGPAKMEQYRTAFSNMLGGIEEANAQIEKSQKFAIQTPFNLDNLLAYQQQLSAVGVQAKDLIPLLTDVGDAVAAAGGGNEQMGKAVLAVTQIIARGKVSAQEMNQLANANVVSWRILADTLRVSVGDAMKMAEEGKISSQEFLDALHEFSSANYSGMMERQSRTLLGLVSNLNDVIQVLGTAFGEKAMNTVTQKLGQFIDHIQTPEVEANLKLWGDRFERVVNLVFMLADEGGRQVQKFLTVIEPVTAFLGEFLDGLPSNISAQEEAYNRAAAAAGKMAPPIAAASEEAEDNADMIEQISDAMKELGYQTDDLRNHYEDMIDPLKQQLDIIDRTYRIQNEQADIAELQDRIARNTLLGGDYRSSMGAQAREDVIRDTNELAKKQREANKNAAQDELRDRIAQLEDQRETDLRAIELVKRDLERAMEDLRDQASEAGTEMATSFTSAVSAAWKAQGSIFAGVDAATNPDAGTEGAKTGGESNLFLEKGKEAADQWLEGFGTKFDEKWAEFWQQDGPAFDMTAELMRIAGVSPDTRSGEVADLLLQWLSSTFDRMGAALRDNKLWAGGPSLGDIFGVDDKSGSGGAEDVLGPGGVQSGGGFPFGQQAQDWKTKDYESRRERLEHPSRYQGQLLPANPYSPKEFPTLGPGWQNNPPPLGPGPNDSLYNWDTKNSWDDKRLGPNYGGRGAGGLVYAGESYTVGESGPEIFRPKQDGYVQANYSSGGGRGAEIIHRCPDCNRTFVHSEMDHYVDDNPDRISRSLGAYIGKQ